MIMQILTTSYKNPMINQNILCYFYSNNKRTDLFRIHFSVILYEANTVKVARIFFYKIEDIINIFSQSTLLFIFSN